MIIRSQFAYTQARLQARHGKRPSPQVWQQLQGIGDLRNYLYAARRTSLRNWVMGLAGSGSSHEIELLLRSQFSRHVDEVARWMPAQWTEPVLWVKQLPYLPALRHLLSGRTAPAWMHTDPVLSGLTSEDHDRRIDAIEQSGFAGLVENWQADIPLTDAWLDEWHRKLPGSTRHDSGIRQLGYQFKKNISAFSDEVQRDTSRLRLQLELQLVHLFRRYSFEATAAFAHLGLTALDLERLRGDLILRSVFPSTLRTAS